MAIRVADVKLLPFALKGFTNVTKRVSLKMGRLVCPKFHAEISEKQCIINQIRYRDPIYPCPNCPLGQNICIKYPGALEYYYQEVGIAWEKRFGAI